MTTMRSHVSHAYDGDDQPLPVDVDDSQVSEPKDKPMSHSAPEYKFAGTNMASEPVVECSRCGALLKDSNCFLHSHWHALLDRPRIVQ